MEDGIKTNAEILDDFCAIKVSDTSNTVFKPKWTCDFCHEKYSGKPIKHSNKIHGVHEFCSKKCKEDWMAREYKREQYAEDHQ